MRTPQLALGLLTFTTALAPAFAQSAGNWSRFDNPAAQTSAQQPEGPAPQISSSQPDGSLAQASPEPYPQAPPPTYGQPQNNGGYNNNGPYSNGPYDNSAPAQNGEPYPSNGPAYNGAQGQYSQQSGNYPAPAPQVRIPDTLNMPTGEYVTVRLNNFLSSDHNQPGDAFTASLVEPLVIDGVVVAQRGQLVNGRVVETEKAGRVKGTSSMRIELTGLTLVDGQQLPVKTQLIDRKGRTSNGRDANAIVGTTALGTIVGAAATGTGFGAGMGAIGGAVVGTVGVLVTRGRPTVITPETVMTFRVEQPVTISTVHSAGAFYAVSRDDYGNAGPRGPGVPRFAAGPYAGVGAYPYAGVGAYPYAPYPYYGAFWGPSFYFRGGYGYYGRGGYYGRWGRR